jgi:purine nucleoside phosphorylase
VAVAVSPDAARAAESLAERTGVDRHEVAVVLGSGWGPAAEALGTPETEVAMAELPGFLPPSADGHRGQVLSVAVENFESSADAIAVIGLSVYTCFDVLEAALSRSGAL